jgi:superfamily II DNA/RNA helicase
MPQTFDRPRTQSRRPARPTGSSGSRSRQGSRSSGRRPSSSGSSSSSVLEAALNAAAETPAPADLTFAELGLPAPVLSVLSAQGMKAPFAIQTRVLPDALAGRDVLGRAQTGSGKTLAFGLPVLTRLADSGSRRVPKRPQALILVPTRELARQVADALQPLADPLNLRITTVVGGLSIQRQVDALRRGVDVVVATPGRLIDLMERDACDLSALAISVLDEADHMADLGFLPAVKRILDATPKDAQRLLLSATLDGGVDQLVRDYLTEPAFHAVAASTSAAADMDHKVFTLRHDDKLAVASEIAVRPARTLFFVRTKHGADRLAKQLSRAGAEAAAIHGNLNQNQRQRALDAFAAGHPRVLVATDVAARGIHVDDVDLVVHYDLPNDHKDYLHRSGRTARAGNRGTVVAFVEPFQTRDVNRLHRDAAVTATTDTVHAGHDAVLELAASGEPVVVKPLVDQSSREGSRSGRPGGPGRRPGGPGRSGRPGQSSRFGGPSGRSEAGLRFEQSGGRSSGQGQSRPSSSAPRAAGDGARGGQSRGGASGFSAGSAQRRSGNRP